MKRLSDLLGEALDRRELLRSAEAQTVLRRWSEVVGGALATHTAPDAFDRGTVWVCTSGSAWAQEVRLRRETILNRLNGMARSPGLFRDLKVSVRSRHMAAAATRRWTSEESAT